MKCPKCGKELNNLVCPACGFDLKNGKLTAVDGLSILKLTTYVREEDARLKRESERKRAAALGKAATAAASRTKTDNENSNRSVGAVTKNEQQIDERIKKALRAEDAVFMRPEESMLLLDELTSDSNRKSSFRMPIEGVYALTGRETSVAGMVEQGFLEVGMNVQVELKSGKRVPATVKRIDQFRKQLEYAIPGEGVGIILDGVDKQSISDATTLLSVDKNPVHDEIDGIRGAGLAQWIRENGIKTKSTAQHRELVKIVREYLMKRALYGSNDVYMGLASVILMKDKINSLLDRNVVYFDIFRMWLDEYATEKSSEVDPTTFPYNYRKSL